MRKVSWAMVFGACVMLAGAPAAWAGKDYCYDSAGLTIVAKSHKLPKAGKCSKSFDGVTGVYMVMGQACMNTAGTKIRVGYTMSYSDSYETGNLEIPFPALTGGTANYCSGSGGAWSCTTGGTASVALCVPSTIPID